MIYASSSEIIEFFQGAQSTVVIVAPFIKCSTLERVLSVLPSNLSELIVMTRWNPQDIATGVCDIGIFELIQAQGGSLRIHTHLHAKYFRVDERCLVGSANVTGRGFGWVRPPNVELVVDLPVVYDGLVEWEERLLQSGVLIDEEIRHTIEQAAKEIEPADLVSINEEKQIGGSLNEDQFNAQLWIPTCTVPERLWDVYRGRGEGKMVRTAYEAAKNDLSILAPPLGLTRSLFERFIQSILRQMPLMYRLDALTRQGLPDGDAMKFLSEHRGTEHSFSSEMSWKTIKDWFMYFFPDEYRIETSQEILVQGKKLDR